MHVNACWNGFQYVSGADICGLPVYMYVKQIVFAIISYLHCFVHKIDVFDANFNSPDNQDWLFFKYHTILAGCLHVQKISIAIG